jgi:hypothetical protein
MGWLFSINTVIPINTVSNHPINLWGGCFRFNSDILSEIIGVKTVIKFTPINSYA